MTLGLLTQELETRLLTWALVNPFDTSIPVSLPIKVRLMSANGNASTAGTEVTGDAYSAIEATFSTSTTSTGALVVNTASIEFAALDTATSKTVVGVELWDSSDTPVRLAFAPLLSTFSVAALSPFIIGIGQLKVSLV